MALLKQPLQSGALPLHNRLVMPPMATAKSNPDGTVSDALIAYYDEKSKDGALGLIIIEHSFISPAGKAGQSQLSAADDSVIPALSRLAQTIQKNGAKAVMQLNHAGSAADPAVTECEVVGPSAVLHPNKGAVLPRDLSVPDIKELVRAFAKAAVRVKKAGFDGVEIHSAHGYLLSQFLSPLTNKRSDSYGGNILSRCKIHVEVLKAVREAVGDDFPILLRLGASDYTRGGLTKEESVIASPVLVKAGADLIDISGGMNGDTIPGVTEPGYFSPLSRAIKDTVDVPVLVTGGIKTGAQAEEVLKRGDADLIGVGKAILKDSSWAKNALDELG